jgi:hypothetical protein
MKYIIKESQYNTVVDKTITHLLNPHDEITLDNGYVIWTKDGEAIVQIENFRDEVDIFIENEIFFKIMDYFDINSNETDEVFSVWFKKHYFFEKEIYIGRYPLSLTITLD